MQMDGYVSHGSWYLKSDRGAISPKPHHPPSINVSRDQQNHLIHWSHGDKPHSGSRSDDDDGPGNCPFTPPPPRERLNYTRYQLELLRVIFEQIRYPNSVQKQVIAKRVGITRDQVKIWFQNRRRKDVLAKQTPPDTTSPADSTTPDTSPTISSSTIVPKLVLDSIVTEILKFKTNSTSKKNRCKRKLEVPCKEPCEPKRPKINYDMVNPPNRVTPNAFNGAIQPFHTANNSNTNQFNDHNNSYSDDPSKWCRNENSCAYANSTTSKGINVNSYMKSHFRENVNSPIQTVRETPQSTQVPISQTIQNYFHRVNNHVNNQYDVNNRDNSQNVNNLSYSENVNNLHNLQNVNNHTNVNNYPNVNNHHNIHYNGRTQSTAPPSSIPPPSPSLTPTDSDHSSPDSAASALSFLSLPVLSDLHTSSDLQHSPDLDLHHSPNSLSSRDSPDIPTREHRHSTPILSPILTPPYFHDNFNNQYPYKMIAQPAVLMSSLQSDPCNPYHESYWHAESPNYVSISTVPNPYYDMYRRGSPEHLWNRPSYEDQQYAQL